MADIRDQLRGLLESPKLLKSLTDTFYSGLNSPTEFQEFDLAAHLKRARRTKLKTAVKGIMQELVVDELPVPVPVTAEDLTSIAIAQLVGVPLVEVSKNEDAQRAYQRFVSIVLGEIQSERTDTRTFQLGVYSIRPDEIGSYYLPDFPLWSSPTRFTLHGDSVDDGPPTHVAGYLRGYCTHRALKRLHSKLEDILGSIVKTIRSCVTSGDCNCADDDPIYCPPISFLERDGSLMMAASLSAMCEGPVIGKDELLDRLRNAIVLLFQSDQIESEPVALSLSFAAIEALVCEKHRNPVNQQIKEHVSTLLVADVQRRRAGEKVLGKLYDIRCDVLHGTKVHASFEATEAVRRIAAGVIRALACWLDHHQKLGRGKPPWKEFMNEVHAAARAPQEVPWVPDLSELIPETVPS